MIVGDKLILMRTACDERYFVHLEAISTESIIAILHKDFGKISVDLSPTARHLSLKKEYKTILDAFYDLDSQVAFAKGP